MKKTILLFLVAWLGLTFGENISYAEALQKNRIDAEFSYVVDKSSGQAVPQVSVTRTNYSDYSIRQETYSFENLAVKKPSAGKLDFNSNQYTGTMHIVDNGRKMYWNNHFTITTKPETYVSRLYEFDTTTNKMKIVKELSGNIRHIGRIDVYPDSQTYAINPDRLQSSSLNDVAIYSLKDSKLLGKVNSVRMKSRDVQIDYWDFTKLMASNTLLVIKYEKKKDAKGSEYEGEVSYEMAPNGSMKKLTSLLPNAKVKWEKKVGTLVYANYYDAKKKTWFVGSKRSGEAAFTPISHAGVETNSQFSPNDKYLLITEYKLDAKKKERLSYVTLVVDVKSGKVLKELPSYNRQYKSHTYIWDYGDELVKVYFYERARAGYLNLSTGIFVSEYGEPGFGSATFYSGNFADLLTPERSPEMILDDETRIVLPAQGAFLSDQEVWYVGLRDMAAAIGATVSRKNEAFEVSRNGKIAKINAASIINFRDRAYVPMKDLRIGLGLKLQINAPEKFYKYK